MVDIACAISLADLFGNFGSNTIGSAIRAIDSNDIANARDHLVDEMLGDPTFTHILFVDCDMAFPPRLVASLINAKRDVIGLAYPQRFIDGKGSPLGYVPDSIKPADFNSEEPIEVECLGMGLCLIARQAFEKLQATRKIAKTSVNGKPRLRFFLRITHGVQTFSEDISFCLRWRDLCGGKLYAIASRDIAHITRVEVRASPI